MNRQERMAGAPWPGWESGKVKLEPRSDGCTDVVGKTYTRYKDHSRGTTLILVMFSNQVICMTVRENQPSRSS
jgi:hypothetical protein